MLVLKGSGLECTQFCFAQCDVLKSASLNIFQLLYFVFEVRELCPYYASEISLYCLYVMSFQVFCASGILVVLKVTV
jgi:hypothetical protein